MISFSPFPTFTDAEVAKGNGARATGSLWLFLGHTNVSFWAKYLYRLSLGPLETNGVESGPAQTTICVIV